MVHLTQHPYTDLLPPDAWIAHENNDDDDDDDDNKMVYECARTKCDHMSVCSNRLQIENLLLFLGTNAEKINRVVRWKEMALFSRMVMGQKVEKGWALQGWYELQLGCTPE